MSIVSRHYDVSMTSNFTNSAFMSCHGKQCYFRKKILKSRGMQEKDNGHGLQRTCRMISVINLFRVFEIITFCFVVAICDLVYDVETIFHLFDV